MDTLQLERQNYGHLACHRKLETLLYFPHFLPLLHGAIWRNCFFKSSHSTLDAPTLKSACILLAQKTGWNQIQNRIHEKWFPLYSAKWRSRNLEVKSALEALLIKWTLHYQLIQEVLKLCCTVCFYFLKIYYQLQINGTWRGKVSMPLEKTFTKREQHNLYLWKTMYIYTLTCHKHK